MNRYVVAALACFGIFAVYIAICLAVGGTNHFLVAGLMVAVAGTWVAIVKSMKRSRSDQVCPPVPPQAGQDSQGSIATQPVHTIPPPIIESLPKQKLSVDIPMTPAEPPANERRDVHKTKGSIDTLLRVVFAVVWIAVGVVCFKNGYLEGDIGTITYCLLFPVPVVFLLFWKKRRIAFALVILGFALWGGVILVRGAIFRANVMRGLKDCVASAETIIPLDTKPSTQATADAPQLPNALDTLNGWMTESRARSEPISLLTTTPVSPAQLSNLRQWLGNALLMARKIRGGPDRGSAFRAIQNRASAFRAIAATQFQCGDTNAALEIAEEAGHDADSEQGWGELLEVARLQAATCKR